MRRVFNFSAGPSMLPLAVLKRAAEEMTDCNGTGQSVMEMSHRSADFEPIISEAERLIRKLMRISGDYTVLFMQGGGSTQFAMVPLNLAGTEPSAPFKKATYIDTGIWASKAAAEAAKYLRVRIGASSKESGYTEIPAAPASEPDDSYYYICLNNTIMGTRWTALPAAGAVPLVSDISSCILSEPIDVSRFGLLFAGAQKNMGPAGCTVVIIRNDLIRNAPPQVPEMLRYQTHAKEKSLYNTPPCYCIYMISLVLKWLDELGGVDEIYKINRTKADMLYNYIDGSSFYNAPVKKENRSLMNVRFGIHEPDAQKRALLESRFAAAAAQKGLVNLAGHRLAGGLRASIYNAMPLEGVHALIGFMEQYKKSV